MDTPLGVYRHHRAYVHESSLLSSTSFRACAVASVARTSAELPIQCGPWPSQAAVSVRQKSVSVSVRQGSVSVPLSPCVRMVRRPLLVLLLLLVGCAVRQDTESLVSAVPRHLAVCLSAVTPQCRSTACLDTCLIDQRDAASRRPEEHRVEAAPACPEHWLRYDDGCYLIPDEKRTWMVAHHACARLDRRARLASIHRDNIQDVAGVLDMAPEASEVWIGLVRVSSDPSTFGWIDGTPFDVSNWSPGEPNNAHQNISEDCVHLQGAGFDEKGRYKWNDISCSKKFNFLCQINLAG